MQELVVKLCRLPDVPFALRGIYGKRKNALAQRQLYLHPEAARAVVRLESDFPNVFRYTDVYRTAEGSRRVREKYAAKHFRKHGTKRYWGLLPGSSAHNYGLALDHDITGNLLRLQMFFRTGEFVSKRKYDELMRIYGFFCHRDGPVRGDHKRHVHEEWHYNYLGTGGRWWGICRATTAAGVEARIQSLYGPFRMDTQEIQRALATLNLYAGAIDGVIGPATRWSVKKFQRTWTLKPDGDPGPRTQRVILFVNAKRDVDLCPP